jgi:predicted MPP superfamily phosphohydrolase
VRRLRRRAPWVLRHEHATTYDLGASLDRNTALSGLGRVFGYLPGNEILRVEITEKTLGLPRLPQRLAGLSIAHVSDLHFTGRIGKAYFERVIELTNDLQADLILLTGDLVESAACFSWIEDTLARLSARYGTYFVLGNHDLRADPRRLRRLLVEAGHVNLGGSWRTIEIDGECVLLAGNELPWMAPAADLAGCPNAALRILLSHSPDQFEFARRHDFDLLLAGHTHGGQVQLPLLGPIFAPSRHGVKYASGTFYEPPTVMHVTRGVSGEVPLRWNCLPEVAKLTLVPATRISDVDKDRPLAAATR